MTRNTPLRIQFVITSLPVGGAEVLLLNMIRKMDRLNFEPEVICMKEPGELGEEISQEVPLHSHQLSSKWDLGVLFRLTKLFKERKTDAVITIGAGDKMFWGRLAARRAGVPVICSALHSTGWPDGVGRMNRWLTPITSGFIACAEGHADHLSKYEKFPRERVFMIPNGVDTGRFKPNAAMRAWLRDELDVEHDCPCVGIIAALREEKNHIQFVRAAKQILRHFPNAQFVIVGDGPERANIEAEVSRLAMQSHFHLLGSRSDTERILAGLDVFTLTSKNEANPVSILEALSCGIPVVAPDVGSISENVIDESTGFLAEPLSEDSTADLVCRILGNDRLVSEMSVAGRQLVQDKASLEVMVGGYENLVATLYNAHSTKYSLPLWERKFATVEPAEIAMDYRFDEAATPAFPPTTTA